LPSVGKRAENVAKDRQHTIFRKIGGSTHSTHTKCVDPSIFQKSVFFIDLSQPQVIFEVRPLLIFFFPNYRKFWLLFSLSKLEKNGKIMLGSLVVTMWRAEARAKAPSPPRAHGIEGAEFGWRADARPSCHATLCVLG